MSALRGPKKLRMLLNPPPPPGAADFDWRNPDKIPTNDQGHLIQPVAAEPQPMTNALRNRLVLSGFGAIAGVCFYAIEQALSHDLFSDRLTLALGLFILMLFGGAISMASAVPLRRAALMSAVLGATIAALASWAGLRFVPLDQFDWDPVTIMAVLVLGFLPLPFLMAAQTSHWRNYSTVFRHAWALFLRLAFAWLFVGLVWALIYLSDALFDLVGLPIIDQLLDVEVTPWIVTGLVFGLAVAIVDELSDYMSPYLILQVMRLLVPFVLVVLVVFLLALPFRGLNGLFGDLSAAGILLTMAAGAVALISAAADEADDTAPLPGFMMWASQGLALISVVPAALGAWAIWTRVVQYGWTPERLFAAWAAAFILCYTTAYAVAVLRGAWRARVRQANIYLALGLIASAALWLTPLLNPQGISAQSHIARFTASGFQPDTLDLFALNRWGEAGKTALANQAALAKEPGQTKLATALAQSSAMSGALDAAALRISLAKIMPLQPNTPAAIAARDRVFAAAEADQLKEWQDDCDATLPGGQPGCAMVVADLHTGRPGDEVVIAHRSHGQFFAVSEITVTDGYAQARQLVASNGQYPQFDQAVAILQALQSAAPAVVPSPLMMLKLRDTELMIAQ